MWHLKKDVVERWSWAIPYTKEGCDKIIELGDKLLPKEIKIDNSGNIVRSVNGTSCSIPINDDTRWIFETLSKHIIEINNKFFEYDLQYISELQFTLYDEKDDFFPKHLDALFESAGVRKLSFMVQLSDPETYGGNDHLLHFDEEPTIIKKDIGSMTTFPSHTLNEVTPLKKGKRYVLSGWVVGPRFK